MHNAYLYLLAEHTHWAYLPIQLRIQGLTHHYTRCPYAHEQFIENYAVKETI